MNKKLIFLFVVLFVICLLPLARADVVFQEKTVMGRLFQHWEMQGENEVIQDIKFYPGLSPQDYQAVYGNDVDAPGFFKGSFRRMWEFASGENKYQMDYVKISLAYFQSLVFLSIEPIINELHGMIIINQLETKVNEYAFIYFDDFKDKCNNDRLCIWCSARYKVMKEYQVQYKLTEMEFLYGNSGNSCYPFHEILKEL